MSAPVDRHTLAVFVRALERALRYEWRGTDRTAHDVAASRFAAQTLVAWGRALCDAPAADRAEPDA